MSADEGTAKAVAADIPRRLTSVESRIDAVARLVLDHLPSHGRWGAAVEFVVFGLKQAWACLYGGLLLVCMTASALWWPADAPLARYDALLIAAVLIQIGMVVGRLERPSELTVILLFHAVGTGMEVFKTAAGSWTYPEPSVLRLGGVPLFSGFMYGAVGSYLARITRIFDFRFTRYPARGATLVLAALIYANFFTHHFIVDLRGALFLGTAILFARTWVHYRVFRFRHRMPLLVGFGLVSLFIWIAENAATYARIWLYPHQTGDWAPVSLHKLGAWYLLMIISFVLVTLVHRPRRLEAEDEPARVIPA